MSKKIQTTEATGKRWKLMQLIGVTAIFAGAIWVMAMRMDSLATEERPNYAVPLIAIAGGLFLWVFGRVGAWWHHG